MLFTMIGDWFSNTMAFFFVNLLDTMAYALLGVSYNIFFAVSRLNLFGGSAAGQQLYDTITQRFYNVLSIIMIFVFAYQLIMLIIDPDSKDKKASGTLVRETIVSIVFIILSPTIFKYMSVFQNHVIENNTIGAIILGQNGMSEGDNVGKDISLMVFMSFYHPYETTYSIFFDEDGNIRNDAVSRCTRESGSESTCKKFTDGLTAWQQDTSLGVGTITRIKDLRHSIGDTMEYMWILSTVAGVAAAWFFLAYSIAMGTRAVKLGVLQIITPIPLILKIFPPTRKTYETWFGEIKKTYVEVFIRLGVIFLVVALIQQVPLFIDIIFNANNEAGSGLTKNIATVCLILGMLKFAKDAPDLFKTLFSNGSNLFSGLNFSPRIRSHVESNPYAMKAIGFGTGAIGGAIGTFGKAAYESFKNSGGAANSTLGRSLGQAALSGLTSMPRGVISGGTNGFKNSPTKLTFRDTLNRAGEGLSAGQNSYENRRFKDTGNNIANTIRSIMNPNSGTTWGEDMRNFASTQGGLISEWASDETQAFKVGARNALGRFFGYAGNDQLASSAANEITSSAESMIDQASVANTILKNEKEAVQRKVNEGETYVGKDGRNYRTMFKEESNLTEKYGGIVGTVVKTSSGGITISEATTGNGKRLQIIENANTNERTYITEDGFAFKVDATTNKVISRTSGASALSNAEAIITASVSNQNIQQAISGATVQGTAIVDPATGETTRTLQSATGQQIIEVTTSSGDRTYKMDNLEIKLDSSGNVQSKNVILLQADGQSRTVDITNATSQQIQQTITEQEAKDSVYNIQQIYDEFDDREAENIAKALNETAEGRRARAGQMLEEYKNNYINFSDEFRRDNDGAAAKFESKYGEKIDDFLERMFDRNHTLQSITKDDAKRLKEVKKIMTAEKNRAKLSAELKQKEQERLAAKNKKNNETK